MQTQPNAGLPQALSLVVGDMARAVSRRPGENEADQAARASAAAVTIGELLPTNMLQVILASHCVMFHELLTDSVQESLRTEPDRSRAADRARIVAMNKAFHDNLDRLDRYQGRAAARPERQATPPAPPVEAQPELEDFDPDLYDFASDEAPGMEPMARGVSAPGVETPEQTELRPPTPAGEAPAPSTPDAREDGALRSPQSGGSGSSPHGGGSGSSPQSGGSDASPGGSGVNSRVGDRSPPAGPRR